VVRKRNSPSFRSLKKRLKVILKAKIIIVTWALGHLPPDFKMPEDYRSEWALHGIWKACH